MIRSTHIMLEPNTQAITVSDNRYGFVLQDVPPIPLTQVMTHPLVSLSRPIFAALNRATQQLASFGKPGDKMKIGKRRILGEDSVIIKDARKGL